MRLKNKNKDELFDKVISRLVLIVIGALVAGLSPLMNDLVLTTIEFALGLVMVIIGTFSLIYLVVKKRRGMYGRNHS